MGMLLTSLQAGSYIHKIQNFPLSHFVWDIVGKISLEGSICHQTKLQTTAASLLKSILAGNV
jgi:hypothetical protein